MKRLVSIFLSLMILLCCVVPVSATGLDPNTNGYSYDGLPYLSDQYYYTGDISDGSSVTLTFTPPSIFSNLYIEGTLITNDNNPSFSSEMSVFNLSPLGNSVYHFSCYFSNAFKESYSIVYTKGGGNYFEFLTFNVSPIDYTKDDLSFFVNMQGSYSYRQYNDPYSDQPFTDISTSFNETVTISGTTYARPPLLHQNTNTSQYQYNESSVFVTTYIYFDWTKYDRVDFMLWNGYDSITDCVFYVDGVSVLDNCYPSVSPKSVSMVSLDFSSLGITNSNLCYIRLRGYKELDSSTRKNLVQIPKVTAFVPSVSNNFWPSWLMKIIDKLDNIFTGRGQDQTAADSFNDSISDQSNELEDLTADLNSVTRPPLSDVNLSTNTMVDSGTVVLATSGLGSIMSNTIILRVFLMALTFALAGFILFGKR